MKFPFLFILSTGVLIERGEQTVCADPSKECVDDSLRIVVFIGSTRESRNADRVTKYIVSLLEQAGHRVDIVDPLNPDIPLLRKAIHFYSNPTEAPEYLQELDRKVSNADAFVLVSAEYNRLPPPALLNLLDHIPPSHFGFKSSAIITYSVGNGGEMVIPSLRSFMVEMGAPPVPYSLHISQVQKVLDSKGNVMQNWVIKGADKMIKQFEWFAHAFRNHRQTFGVPESGYVLSG